jgi:hypothetical protein
MNLRNPSFCRHILRTQLYYMLVVVASIKPSKLYHDALMARTVMISFSQCIHHAISGNKVYRIDSGSSRTCSQGPSFIKAQIRVLRTK